MNTPSTPTNRPIGVAHLIFGLIFTGIAAIWLIGEASDTKVGDLAAGFPVVLIGAGLIGLGASVVSQRRAKARLLARTSTDEPTDTTDDTTDDSVDSTLVLNTDKDES